MTEEGNMISFYSWEYAGTAPTGSNFILNEPILTRFDLTYDVSTWLNLVWTLVELLSQFAGR